MNRIPILVLFVCLFSSLGAKTLPIFQLTTSKSAQPQRVNGTFRFALDENLLKQAYAEKSFSTTLSRYAFDPTDLAGITDVELDLTQFSIIGPETEVIIKTANGEIPGVMPTVHTYRGTVRGIEGSLVVLSINPAGTVSGFVRFTNNTYTISAQRGEALAAYMIKNDDIENFADLSRCEMSNEAEYMNPAKPTPKRSVAKPQAATQSMKMAVDVDKDCNDYFGGSSGDITNYINDRFAAISAVYEDEVDLGIVLGRIYIYTVPDPYAASPNIDSLLQRFTRHWRKNNAGVDRTLAHLFSKQELDGGSGASGLAWVEGMCDKLIGYGVTRIMDNPGVDNGVIAHEVGHNVGSHHTHNCFQYDPPIDSCFPAEGGCFSGTKQIKGTIMSYCNSKNFTFHPRTRAVFTQAISNAPCLGSLAQIQVKSDSIIFPGIAINAKKDTTLTAFIKNTGTVPLTISSIEIEIVNAEEGEFTLKSLPALPLTLQPNATQNISVSFQPLSPGEHTADLRISHNAGGAVSVIGMRGVATTPIPVFELELDYGVINFAGNYDTAFAYVENWGDGPLTISKFEFTDVNASEFSIIGGGAPPNVIVPPDSIAIIKIRFTPKSVGPKYTKLLVTHDAYDPPLNVDQIEIYADVAALESVHALPGTNATFAISPNPATDRFTISVTGVEAGTPCEITLVDQLGRIVAEIASEKLSTEGFEKIWMLDASIANGTYQLVAKIGASTISERVVILKK